MRLTFFVIILIGISRYGYGQNFRGSDFLDRSTISFHVTRFSDLLFKSEPANECLEYSFESNTFINQDQGLFAGKGIDGVYIEISNPMVMPDLTLKDRGTEAESDDFHKVCHFNSSRAASNPLFPLFVPARSIACSMLSVVRMP